MRFNTSTTAMLLSALALAGCGPQQGATSADAKTETANSSEQIALWPQHTSPLAGNQAQEQQIQKMLAAMTPAQKVAQLIQPDIRWMSLDDMRQYGFGSYLNGGGAYPNDNKQATAADWLALADAYYQAAIDDSLDGSTIPPIWGTDAVHGHNNVYGATVFPHNIGLGASNNPQLVEAIGKATAEAVSATGINWIFAPTVAVARNDRWGRSYESYSEDPAIVASLGAALVQGIQGKPGQAFLSAGHTLATAKHFLGDGGTEQGKDQGNNLSSEAELVKLHAPGYFSSLDAGVQTIMASFNSWHGAKMHGNQYLLTQVLKQRLGFDGVVVGDWNGHGQIPGCSNTNCAAAINAGVDILMAPEDWKGLYNNTLQQVASGEISAERLNDAVARVLRVKLRAGLFERGAPSSYAADAAAIASPAHQAIAAQAVRESLVLLKNNNQLLPLAPTQHFLVAGDAADNIGKQSGGWTLTWQGTGNTNADFPNGRSIYSGLAQQITAAGGSVELSIDGQYQQKPDVAIVVIGENPYAEFDGDVTTLDYQPLAATDLALLKKLKADGIKVVTVFISGRPLWVNPELNQSDAFVAAWLPGTAGQAVADVLLRDAKGNIQHDFKGKLPFSWPAAADAKPINVGDADYAPLFAFGFGLNYQHSSELTNALPEQTENSSLMAKDSLSLFERRPANGYSLLLVDAQGQVSVTGNKSQSPDGSLTLAAVNWQKQEDALQLNWLAGSTAKLLLQAAVPLDATSYGQLSFDINWPQQPTAALELGLSCGSGCGGMIDIGPLLQSKAAAQWHSLVIDLGCFADTGTALNHLQQPFVLQSQSAMQLSIANIRLTPATATADLRCSAD